MTHHNIIPAALSDYCEAIRQSRLKFIRGNAEMFESVVKDACAIPPGTPTTLKEIITDSIKRTVKDCGRNTSEAARILGVSRSTVYYHTRKAVAA